MGIQRGSKKLAILRCKYSDKPQEPNNDNYYTDLFIARGTGGLNDYYVSQSHGNVNFDGSTLFPWKTIPFTQAKYWETHASRDSRIQGACTAHGVDRTKYFAVVAIFNDDTGNSSSAGNGILCAANDTQDLQVTFLAHELGHVFGFMDSYDESDRTGAGDSTTKGWYWDQYDIMSARNVFSTAHPRWNVTGPSLCAASQDWCGWLAPAQIHSPPVDEDSTTEVRVYAYPANNNTRYSCIKFDQWYVEFRTPTFWDVGIARPCVLIHSMTRTVNAVLHNRSHINGVWNNEWLVGASFGVTPAKMRRFGGTRIEILGFNVQPGNSYARVRVVTATAPEPRPPRPPRLPPGRGNDNAVGSEDEVEALMAPLTELQSLRDSEETSHVLQQIMGDIPDQGDWLARAERTIDVGHEVATLTRLRGTLEGISVRSFDSETPPPGKKIQ